MNRKVLLLVGKTVFINPTHVGMNRMVLMMAMLWAH